MATSSTRLGTSGPQSWRAPKQTKALDKHGGPRYFQHSLVKLAAVALSLSLSAALTMAVAGCGGSGSSAPPPAPPAVPVSCASLTTLRDFGSHLSLFTNPRTGDELEYVVVGDGAKSNDLVVMFNGTSEVMADWPILMLTNSQASPKIVATDAYTLTQDGPISLCHDYRLLLFDYPGVGYSSIKGNVTLDQISNDVDAMLDSIGSRYQIPTDQVDLVGWSLGSIGALKYSFLAPKARPGRTIRNQVLIATKPGGNTDGFVDGNQAPCVSTLFDYSKNNPNLPQSFKDTLDHATFELLFPYVGEPPYDDPTIDCTATIDPAQQTVTLNVTPDCPVGSECFKNLLVEEANRLTPPWSITDGIDSAVFVQQREQANDYGLCYCSTTDGSFNSTGCSCSGSAPEMSSSNGGICQTVSTGTTQPNAPISSNCVALDSGPITVLNGPEDLFIQHTYGQELVSAYQQAFGPNRARIVTYPGTSGAGHGVLLQHPMWMQQQIYDAIND